MVSDPTARQWCEQAAKGDYAAAAKLLREFHSPIFAYLRRLSGNDADAADLAQVTFVKVWRSLGQFRGLSSVATWIHRIAYRTYLDWVRRDHQATDQSDAWWQNLPAGTADPFNRAAEAESARRLYRAVEGLEAGLRQAIHLHYYQGLSLAETAEILELPTSTLKYRLRSALEELRAHLEESAMKLVTRCSL